MLALGNKIIAGSFKTGASWEVGDVGISAFGIDEALNKRRYLNGQVISQAQFVQFTAMLKSRVSVYPNLATTEVNWQATVTNSDLGQCGQFVIDDVAGTIRLPKVVNINGLQNLTGLGGIKAESLPNITGESSIHNNPNYTTTGAFTVTDTNKTGSSISAYDSYVNLAFDASLSSSTYQDNAPVQQEAVQYPYFIQVATGVETSIDVSREIELNLPFSLLDYKYSEYELDNASWLISNGQYNSGATYPAVYNLLLAIYNGTTTKAGVSVKLSTETYADTDFVLNTSDTTFRLPIKVLMAGSKRVVGNGMTLGLATDTDNFGLIGQTYSLSRLTGKKGDYGSNIGSSIAGDNVFVNDKTVGITTDETKSGIETSANGLYLYFYVGETVQDANIIAASGVLTDMTNIKNGVGYSQTGKETIIGWGMPDYSAQIALSTGTTEQTYTAPSKGYIGYNLMMNGNNTGYVKVNDIQVISNRPAGAAYWDFVSGIIPVDKNDVVKYYSNQSSGEYNNFQFYPLKGVN